MKQWFSVSIGIVLLGFGLSAAAEEITSFDTTMSIQQDASLSVQERIEYDFGSSERHGIYRDIPLVSKAWYGQYGLKMRDIQVTDDAGAAVPFSVSSRGGTKRIKIGDPERLITGAHTYLISYTIDRAITYHDGYDELYWNVTGDDWQVPMKTAAAVVTLSHTASRNALTIRCFAGSFGGTRACDVMTALDDDVRQLRFAHSEFSPGEGMTIVVQFPKGTVYEPSLASKIVALIMDNRVVGIPIAVFCCMLFLWRRYGRDPKGRGTIIAEYDVPDHLTPAEVGTIIDEVTHTKDVTAEIIYLAVTGYLKIRQETVQKRFKETVVYHLLQLKPVDTQLAPYQQTLLEGLFGDKAKNSSEPGVLKEVLLSDLKNTFAGTLSKVRSEATASVVTKGYFHGNPAVPKILFTLLGIGVAGIGFVFSGGSPLHIGSFFASGISIFVIGLLMAKRTYQGVITKEHILGLKEYLRVAEADRLKFHNAPEKKPETFEKLLPFAMVLGVEKDWAEQFKGIYTTDPSWYEGASHGHFSTALFVSNLNTLSSEAHSVLTSSPSSGAGGGGFSGGGFGGGGGGSW